MIYLDTSALVKLIRIAAESAALADWLDTHAESRWITSTLTEIELTRAIRVAAPGGLPSIPGILARLDRFEIDDVVRATATAYSDPMLHSLDAIHLATAEIANTAAPLTAFVTYDQRLGDAATAVGLPAIAPGRS